MLVTRTDSEPGPDGASSVTHRASDTSVPPAAGDLLRRSVCRRALCGPEDHDAAAQPEIIGTRTRKLDAARAAAAGAACHGAAASLAACSSLTTAFFLYLLVGPEVLQA